MARLIALILGLGLLVPSPLAAAVPDGAAEASQKPGSPGERRQGDRRVKWWVDEKSRAELGITDQQSADIEQIFQSTLPTLRQVRKELEELEGKLSEMVKDGTAPVTAVTEQVELVENARAEMNKRRTVMLYRIDRVLSAEQRAKLKARHEREREQRSGSSRH